MDVLLQTLNARKLECEEILQSLLAATAYKFDEALRSKLPLKRGLYLIAEKAREPIGEYLHAGQSGKAERGLYSRIWDQHFCSGDSKRGSSDFIQKVTDRRQLDRSGAKAWIRENCVVRWVVVDEDEHRCWAEHYMLAVLRPKWGK